MGNNKNWTIGFDEKKLDSRIKLMKSKNIMPSWFESDLKFTTNEIKTIDKACRHLIMDKSISVDDADSMARTLAHSIEIHINILVNKYNTIIVREIQNSKIKEYYDSFSRIFSWVFNRQKHISGYTHESVNSRQHDKRLSKAFEQIYKKPKGLVDFISLLDQWWYLNEKTTNEIQKENLGQYVFATGKNPIAKSFGEFWKLKEMIPQYPNYLAILDNIEISRINTNIKKELIGFAKDMFGTEKKKRTIVWFPYQMFWSKVCDIMKKLFKLSDMWSKEK